MHCSTNPTTKIWCPSKIWVRWPISTISPSQNLVSHHSLLKPINFDLEPSTEDWLIKAHTWCCEVCGGVGSLPLSCGDSSNLVVKIWSTHSRRPHSGLCSSLYGRRSRRIGWAFCGVGGFVVPHPSNEDVTTFVEGTSGITSSIPPCGCLVPLLLLILLLLLLAYLVPCYIVCSPSCTSR